MGKPDPEGMESASQFEKAFSERVLGTGGTRLKNAFIKAATFEGMYRDGLPTGDLVEHHAGLARGGVALTTVSYGAVSAGGRTFSDQMYIHDKSLAALGRLADEVHNAGGKVSMQLTHCGYFTRNDAVKHPVAPVRVFNAYGALSGIPYSREMTRDDMTAVAEDFANSSMRLRKTGFDAVEIHMGHGYLLSQFLSPATNKRSDEYGGSIENRARFPLEVFRKIVEKTGSGFPLLVKLNMSDGLKRGFSLEDCKYVSGELEKMGCAAIVLSGGFTSKTPFYLMRGKVPLRGMIRNGRSIAEKLTMALAGPIIIKKYPFSENFFLDQAREIRKAVGIPLVYLGGVDSRKGIEEIMDAGFDYIAIARALIHDPEFLLKLRSGRIDRTECNRCNECVVEMDRGGVRCVL
jgi:2,4-dienoyl-CoA reductase-like NADH-dependent reductase (Old Yellow Enzyme family)